MTFVFVYGTLRPGYGNHRLVQHQVHQAVPALLRGHALYASADAWFPYAARCQGGSIVGVLLQLRPGTARSVLPRLDLLEGYHPRAAAARLHYLRVRRRVTTTAASSLGPVGTTLEAWTYLAGPATPVTHLPTVDGGDWSARTPVRQGRV